MHVDTSNAKQCIYKCYEPDIEGTYTYNDLVLSYESIIDKSEYPTFEGWLYDMVKMGILIKEVVENE